MGLQTCTAVAPSCAYPSVSWAFL